MKKFLTNPKSFGLWLAVVATISALLCLWGHTRQPNINFLPHLSSAEWIIFPATPQLRTYTPAELSTTFKKSFHVDKLPQRAELSVAADRRYAVFINNKLIGETDWNHRDWKRPDIFDVQSSLQVGENQIMAKVLHSNGPPALWLSLKADGRTVKSDAIWDTTSTEGVDSHRAQVASESTTADNIGFSSAYSDEKPWPSLLRHKSTLFFFLVLSALLVFGIEHPPKLSFLTGWCPRDRIILAVLAGLWLALFINNLGTLPSWKGFDVKGHLDYIRYIQQVKAIPTAADGWEMFQPPLYYVLSAVILKITGLSVNSFAGVTLLRFFGLAIGLFHGLVIWASLRLLFPDGKNQRLWGLLLGALSPALIYLSHYITNEALAAALMSACLYACLRILREPQPSIKWCVLLGVGLGAALLTKSTAILLLPPVAGALLWKQVGQRQLAWLQWAGHMALVFGLCGIICGWYYLRVWSMYGSPLVGNWDPRSGFAYWQDNGFQTASYYLRFGHSLVSPWFSNFHSFSDGVYSTLWGDGTFGGAVAADFRPSWNYDLMAMGYLLAIFPSLLIVIGAVAAGWRFIRQPSSEGFLILGLAFLVMFAMVWFSLNLPFYSTVKASFGLGALIPLCVFGAKGLDILGRYTRGLRLSVYVLLGVWCINAYASFWVRHQSVGGLIGRAEVLIEKNRFSEAVEISARALQVEPQNLRALNLFGLSLLGDKRPSDAIIPFSKALELKPDEAGTLVNLATAETAQGLITAALQHYEMAVKLAPQNASVQNKYASLLAQQGQVSDAIEHYTIVLRLAPKSTEVRYNLGRALIQVRRLDEVVQQLQQVLLEDPRHPGVHEFLGVALAMEGKPDEAISQFKEALRYEPDDANTHFNLGNVLAMQHRLAEAAEQYQETLRLVPQHAQSHCHLGAVLGELGRREEAIAHLQEALRLQPDYPEARQQLNALSN